MQAGAVRTPQACGGKQRCYGERGCDGKADTSGRRAEVRCVTERRRSSEWLRGCSGERWRAVAVAAASGGAAEGCKRAQCGLCGGEVRNGATTQRRGGCIGTAASGGARRL